VTRCYADDFVTLHHGDARALATTLAPQSVHAIVTSPPYWGLRDYGEPGQFGLEPTPDAYVARLVGLFALLRPALRDDGTVWLNLGDSYSGRGRADEGFNERWHGKHYLSNKQGDADRHRPARQDCGLKPKDLIGLPWMVAFALRSDGWYLRQDIIWHKPNAMPESVTDRPTCSHEHLFLLAKSERYFYDHHAIKELSQDARRENGRDGRDEDLRARPPGSRPRTLARLDYTERGRNKRSVWTVPTAPLAAAHFATFPPALITPCILAGCPEGGTVLDPFMGSGTTAAVARSLGRKSIGFEMNAEYIAIALKHRLAQGVLL
jgi:DNA modification methylase